MKRPEKHKEYDEMGFRPSWGGYNQAINEYEAWLKHWCETELSEIMDSYDYNGEQEEAIIRSLCGGK